MKKYEALQSPSMKADAVDDSDSDLERGDLNFGRDDSDRGDIISEVDKVDWNKIDTKSILEEI
jgi:hypothetical protein